MSGTYSGSDKRLAYLFENGGGGGGGTTVIANPSGQATDDLEKLQVGETIYDIPTGGSSTLAGLEDVNLSSPTDGQVLKYDATNDEWVNGAGGSSGSDLYLNTIYSETEEKVGYWTDGKPLYQKTLVYNQSYTYATGNWGEIPFSNVPANIERVRIFDVEQLDPNGDVYFDNRVRYFYSNSKIYGISTQSQHTVAGLIITVQYTKTTDTPEVPQRGNVIYLPTIYSEEEREVGVWEDGKPLYQKTLDMGRLINDTNWHYVDHNIANIETICYIQSFLTRTDDGLTYSLSTLRPTTTNGIIIGVGATQVQYMNAWQSEDHVVRITVRYTKTTDTAGSGSWTPPGAPAVHYSTNEQVVGTWIDGKTLYQKTVGFSNLSSGEQTVTMGLSNTETIVKLDINAQVPSGAWLVLPMTYTNTSLIPSYGAISDGYNASTDNVTINIGSDRSFVKGYITIQYTKSS